MSENWRKWRRQFENYLLAINLVLAPVPDAANPPAGNAAISKRQVAILLHAAGEEAYEIYSQFEFADDAHNDDIGDVLTAFETYCNPRRNLNYECFVFWSISQSDGESVDSFLKRLKTQANKCEFGDLKDRMLLCRLLFGLKSAKLQERLLRDADITLDRAVSDIRASEVTRAQLSHVADGDKSSASISKVDARPIVVSEAQKFNCKFCGYQHAKGRCPAYGQSCRKCGGKNHFAKKCLAKSVQAVERDNGQTEVVAQATNLFIGAIESTPSSKSWCIPLKVGTSIQAEVVDFKIDTGAEANIVPKELVSRLGGTLQPTTTTLVSYDKSVIANVGRTNLRVSRGSHEEDIAFEVVDGNYAPILGLESCVQFNLVKRVDQVSSILDEFPEVFEGVGLVEGEHDMQVDPSVDPVVHAARRIPLSMLDKVEQELKNMEHAGIITKVDEPSQWVSSMVVVEKKNGDIRICLDPRDLNRAILREHHHIPTLDDIAFKFNGMRHFTILDMKHGYWHIGLTEKSSLLTTFNTPFGRYRFRRLPFGLHSSAEIFEKKVEQLFGDLNVSIYFDDLIVAGRDQKEHDDNLRKLLTRAREVNVKFNKEKIQLNRSEVKYLGHLVSSEGLKPDPDKVMAIQQMPEPQDKTGVQRLLGTLNFLAPYLPNMSTLTQPLRLLLKNDTVWTWGPEQSAAVETIKGLLTSEPVLKYFDITQPTQLQVDASQNGLGAVLLQDNHPIAYASRSLNSAELNYPQIDKELLAIVFGFERFHQYVYGRPITVQTDHRPLLSIIKKAIHKASPRLQRLLVRLERYHVAEVVHVPGKNLYLADTLSRAFLPSRVDDQVDLEGEKVVMVHSLEVTEPLETQLRSTYQQDPVMLALRDACHNGWNWASKKHVPVLLRPYWPIKDELYEHAGFLYRGERLVIPSAMRRCMLQKIHHGHLGIQKCRERARRSVYWPGLSNDVELTVSNCATCAKFGNRQQKESLLPHDVPELPWNQVAMDIMEFRQNSYLVVVDCYSHFPELRLLKNKTADDVILALKSIFSVHGIPLTIMADNMPFSSAAMQRFALSWGFSIKTSSPHHPKSNGMAERYVQTVKNFLKKCEDTDEDVYPSLLAYRETPVAGCVFSPAEMLFNRCIRSSLPVTSSTLTPTSITARESLQVRQREAKQHYDQTAKDLKPLRPGTPVFTRTGTEQVWSPATVVAQHESPRSYIVDNGQRMLRRNRVHLKPNEILDVPTLPDEVVVPPVVHEEPPPLPVTEPPLDNQLLVASNPSSSTPVRRSQRSSKGRLAPKYNDFIMG